MGRKHHNARQRPRGHWSNGWDRWVDRVAQEAAVLAERELGATERDRIYVRACVECGTFTASLDERLLADGLVCPECSAAALN